MSTVNMYVAVSFSEQVRETDSDGIHQQLSIIRKLLLWGRFKTSEMTFALLSLGQIQVSFFWSRSKSGLAQKLKTWIWHHSWHHLCMIAELLFIDEEPIMESPMTFIGGAGTKSPEYKTTSKETVKLKSFLPKVLLHDNIGLQLDLQKKYRYLKKEEKRSVGFWSHSQKIFIARQCLKETQQGMTLFPYLRKPEISDQINILDKKQPYPVNHFNTFGTSLPKIMQNGCIHSKHPSKESLNNNKTLKLPPLEDPRFLKLEQVLIDPDPDRTNPNNIQVEVTDDEPSKSAWTTGSIQICSLPELFHGQWWSVGVVRAKNR